MRQIRIRLRILCEPASICARKGRESSRVGEDLVVLETLGEAELRLRKTADPALP